MSGTPASVLSAGANGQSIMQSLLGGDGGGGNLGDGGLDDGGPYDNMDLCFDEGF